MALNDPLFDNILNTSPMTQLIISTFSPFGGYPEDLPLPYTSRDNYSCYTEEIGSRVEMISGKTVWEVRGKVIKIHYAYDALSPDYWKKLSYTLRSSHSFNVYYVRDDDYENMYSGEFICESLTPPKFAYAEPDYFTTGDDNRIALPRWHGIDFTLREVAPSTHIPVYARRET